MRASFALPGILNQQAAEPTFSPNDITDLSVWYEGNDIGQANASAVATWSDLSGNSIHVTQGTSGNRPVYRTNYVNGHAAVDFLGDDFLNTTGVSVNPSGVWTFFAVAKFDTLSGTRLIITHDGGSGMPTQRAGQILRTDGMALQSVAFNNSGGSTLTGLDGAPTGLSTGTWYLLESQRQIGTVEALVNASSDGATSISGSANSGNQDFRIGAYTTGTLFMDGQIAEIVGYSRALNSTERSDVRSYLNTKYGL